MIDEIFRLSKELKLEKYDLLLVGDGSGTVCTSASGWACILFDSIKTEITILNGAMSCGSNNFAELIPYIQALWYHEYQRDAVSLPNPRVEIISDSEVTVKCGNKVYARKANASLWAAIDWFETVGYNIHWTHVHRNTNLLSKKTDWIAGQSRTGLENLRARILEKDLTRKPVKGKIE